MPRPSRKNLARFPYEQVDMEPEPKCVRQRKEWESGLIEAIERDLERARDILGEGGEVEAE